MPLCHANGMDIYYEQKGSGPNLVLISGYTANHRSWEKVFPELAKYFTVTVFDNRGVGQTSAPDGLYTTQQMAEDTVALMSALHIDDAFVVGHSLGGAILEYVLIRYPERIKKAMLLCTAAFTSNVKALHYEVNSELAQKGVPLECIVKNAMTFLLGDDFLASQENKDYFLHLIINDPHPVTAAGYRGQRHALFQHDATDALHHIKKPVLSVGGDQDILNPLIHARTLADSIPGAGYHVIQGSGHIPQIEQPSAVINLIRSYCC